MKMPYLTYETIEGRNSLKSAVAETKPPTSYHDDRDVIATQLAQDGAIQDQPQFNATRPSKNPKRELVKGYLNTLASWNSQPLHIRRTLDQFFFHDLPDIKDGSPNDDVDDKVVGKYLKHQKIRPKVIMIDQLWLWILVESMFFYL
jgi:hypothetical protein